MVYPYNITGVWPHVEPLLAPAIDRFGTHAPDDVRRTLLAGNAQLWLQWNSESKLAEAAGVTELLNYPLGLWLRIWLMGVKPGAEALWDEFKKHILAFAYANKCAGIRHEGRKGWIRHETHWGDIDSESVIYNYKLSYGESQP